MTVRRVLPYFMAVCVFSVVFIIGLHIYLKQAVMSSSIRSQQTVKTHSISSILPQSASKHTAYSPEVCNVTQKRRPQPSNLAMAFNGHSLPLADKFPFSRQFAFPQPKIMRSNAEIEKALWVYNLRQFLDAYTLDIQLSLLTSNTKYTGVLLNWLISATVRSHIPLESILTISLDRSLHNLLRKRGIPSILVPPSSLFKPSANFNSDFERVMMLRLAVMRVINHFGMHVVMYDTDAIILKDPQAIYDRLCYNDIIGSVGKIPHNLAAEWGITICIGVVLVKSSEKTEAYWNSMKDICKDSVDDQEKLNCGLKALDIRWINNASSQWNTTVCGVARGNLSVCILPYDDICRQWACEVERRERYYIWHKGGSRTRKDKLLSAREGKTWFLKYKWTNVNNDFTGIKWLKSIAYISVVHS